MRRGPIFVMAMALSCLPAVTGLVGNQSFSHSVPVRVPSQARVGSPQVVDTTVRQPPVTLPSASGAAKPSRDVQREDVGHEATGNARQDGDAASANSPEPQQSADLQRGR